MRACPKCNTEHASDTTTHCRACGAPMGAASDATPRPEAAVQPAAAPPEPAPARDAAPKSAREDDLEFQVYENDSDNREFVGGNSDFPSDEPSRITRKSSVPVEDEEIRPGSMVGSSAADADFESVRGTTAYIPEPAEPIAEPVETAPADDAPPEDTDKIRHLSEAEVKSIASSLYRNDAYLSKQDKNNVMQTDPDKEQLFASGGPIKPPKRPERERTSADDILAEIDPSIPSPKMAGRGRGIAYYYRNLIELKGSQRLMPGDEILIGNRQYELRPKRLSRRTMMIGGGVIFAIALLFLGSLMISDSGGEGRVVGLVVDDYNQPLTRGTEVRFSDLGETFRVNGEGMFLTSNLPAGSHNVEVIRDGKNWASDMTTVAGGEISLVVLRVSGPETVAQSGDSEPGNGSFEPAPSGAARPSPTAAATPNRTTSRSTTKPSTGGTARLALAANVEGAKVALNGAVVGAGNLTFDRLNPGVYNYRVTKDGYAAATGRLTLTAGKTYRLSVELQPLASAEKQQQYTAEDFYFSGLSAVQERDYRSAIGDLEQAVRMNPGYAEAYYALGEAYAGYNEPQSAHDAFLRSAEIYRFGKEYNRAVTAYNEALKINGQSVPALLGRGDLFLQSGDNRAATVDFEQVVRLDKRQTPAYIGLGRARLSQGLADQALKNFKEARTLEPNNPVIYQYLMLCYMEENDFDEVRKAYNQFTQVATPEQISDLQSDQRYAAALRIANTQQ